MTRLCRVRRSSGRCGSCAVALSATATGAQPLDVRGRTVIVVDDGLATGLTDLAAVRALRARGAGRIVVAVPVGPRESVALVAGEADEVVCHTIPRELLGVGRWYQDFTPVSDAEVVSLLSGAVSDRQAPPFGQTSPPPLTAPGAQPIERELRLDIDGVELSGELTLPAQSHGIVIFAHGSGSSRLSPRNRDVAARLNESGLATLLFDLLTEPEAGRRELVFDIPLLARRLEEVTRWAIAAPATRGLPVGYFGASTGAAAALRAAAAAGEAIRAVVSRGGRPISPPTASRTSAQPHCCSSAAATRRYSSSIVTQPRACAARTA